MLLVGTPSWRQPGRPQPVDEAQNFGEHGSRYGAPCRLQDDATVVADDVPVRQFRQVKPSLETQVSALLAKLRHRRVVCSEETGARVNRRNAWEWVLQARFCRVGNPSHDPIIRIVGQTNLLSTAIRKRPCPPSSRSRPVPSLDRVPVPLCPSTGLSEEPVL